MSAGAQQESFYEIFVNKDEEVMIAVHARETRPEDPHILYDGGEHALFHRRKDEPILLDFVHPDARAALAGVKTVLISEVMGKNIVREYDVRMHRVSRLPPLSAEIKPLETFGEALAE